MNSDILTVSNSSAFQIQTLMYRIDQFGLCSLVKNREHPCSLIILGSGEKKSQGALALRVVRQPVLSHREGSDSTS